MEKRHKIKEFFQSLQIKTVSLYASAAGFYILLSLFPAVILFGAILSLIPFSSQLLEEIILVWLPANFQSAAIHTINDVYSLSAPSVLSISAITLLWSASKGIHALLDGMNAALDCKYVGYFRRRLRSVFCLLLLLLSLLLCLALYVFGSILVRCLQNVSFTVSDLLLRILPFRFLIGGTMLSLMFTLSYRFFPFKQIRFRFCLAAGSLAGFGWIVFSYLFSIYVNHFTSSSKLYGRIGILLPMMLWLKICLTILLFGCVLAGLLNEDQFHPFRLLREDE